MPILLLLLVGVLAYLWWRWRRTTLTRACRWREDRRRGIWRCAFCGAEVAEGPPRVCLKDLQP
ncbi:hypothetical protein [Ovoidimarina sediminis]|uniref:hypothetical protein n=1 Tax=Ovoidimarina sediminis TaxID=3079856 RepID=UPI00290C2C4F|nr:hypothetical protein [Rhodophyticola sp. MJ-SS7]MDU8944588.1 hypothetical protein [Rhodophyticola sp. MJ-SS7]